MKKFLISLLVIGIILVGVFLYMIRPVSAPSGSLPTPDTTTSVTTIPDPVTPTEDIIPENRGVFVIIANKSQAKFEIDEVLNDVPFHVVGTTSDVSGSITVDVQNPENSTVNMIAINARTLKTDSQMRDGMIGRMILKSETNEFITFTPKSFSGLPENPVVGEKYTFKTTGVLTIAGTSKDVTFDVTAKADSETSISGTAKSVIKYKDFGISIPQVKKVASVEDDVTLTLDFVALKK